jgi:CrcB protein
MKLLLLMLAGGLGAGARYGLLLWIENTLLPRGKSVFLLSASGVPFPLATLLINVLGSFLLAILATLALHGMVKPEYRLILGTGFLGAFTTFSTFELEAEGLISEGHWLGAGLYIGGNVLLGFAAILLGRFVALRALGASALS